MKHRVLPVAAVLLAGCATTPKAPPAPETVELRFAPKPGSAQIENVDVRTLRVDGREQERRTAMHATATVLEVPEGFALVNENVRFESAAPSPLLDLAARIAEGFRLVVNREGEIVSFHGLEELQPEIMRWFNGLKLGPVPPAVLEQMRAAILEASDPQRIADETAADWFEQVGAWNGKTLEIGRTYEAPAPATYRYRAIERLPCTEGEKEPRCVRLELVSTPSEEARQQAKETLAPLLSAADPNATTGPIEMENRVELVVVPETLDAYRMEERQIVRMTVTSGEKSVQVERDDVETTTWRYE